MPLTAQEQHCIELTLGPLGELYGGSWRVADGSTLDDLYPNDSSPECLLTNGSLDAAVEVKRLTGDEVARAYNEALRSLARALDPQCDGFYVLGPATAFRVPVDQPFLRHLKKEIRRVAPGLRRGETGGVRLPRKAWVALDRQTGPGQVHCCHNDSQHLFEDVAPLITGSFMLADQHLPGHSFVTRDALAAFQAELAATCYRRVHGGSNHLSWFEELPLYRADCEGDDVRGLDVLAVTEARHVDSAVAEAVDYILEKALRKFERKQRWAARHVLVLDRADDSCSAEQVRQALRWFDPAKLHNVDLILLTDNDEVSVVWKNDGSRLKA